MFRSPLAQEAASRNDVASRREALGWPSRREPFWMSSLVVDWLSDSADKALSSRFPRGYSAETIVAGFAAGIALGFCCGCGWGLYLATGHLSRTVKVRLGGHKF